jgi:hypothetical protein
MKITNNKKGFSLLAVLVPLLVLTTLIGVMSTDMIGFMKSSQVSSSSGTMDQARDSILWALRASYYQEVMRVRSNTNPADRVLNNSNLDKIVADALITLGQAAGAANNTQFSYTNIASGTVRGTINLDLPEDIDTTKTKALTIVTDTNTWLDGTQASLHFLKCRITLSGSTNNGFALPPVTTYHHLVFAQIPASQLAISALGNLSLDDSSIKNSVGVDASVYVGNSLTGGGDLDMGSSSSQKIAAGNLTSSTIQKNGSNINSGGNSRFNYEFEKVGADQKSYASNLDKQRDLGLSTPIKPEFMFREGLADDLMDSTVFPTSMTPSEKTNLQQMLIAHQPYYQVPITARYYGNYNTAGSTPAAQYSLVASSSPIDPIHGRATSLPSFIEIEKRSDKDYIQANVFVDEIPLTLGTGDLYLFIGAKDQFKTATDPDAFDKFKIILKRRNDTVYDSYVEKPGLRRITIVSPNDVVMGGNIRFRDSNSPNAVATATVYAREVFFGTSQLNKVDYSGSVAQLNTATSSKSLGFKSVDNYAATSTNIAFKKSTGVSENKGADLYYYQVLMKNKDKNSFELIP